MYSLLPVSYITHNAVVAQGDICCSQLEEYPSSGQEKTKETFPQLEINPGLLNRSVQQMMSKTKHGRSQHPL